MPELVVRSAVDPAEGQAPAGSVRPGRDVFIFPMSFSQRLLWLLDQMEPGSAVFIIPFALRLTGDLEITALQESLSEIVRRHEVLRATFHNYDDAPVQVIHPAGALVMPVIDLSNLPEDARNARMLKLANEDAHRAFDLARGPMMRASLIRMVQRNHVLLLTLHHIVFDGWSRAILVRELARLYEAFSAGQPSPLPEIPLQYTDFAVWQNERLKGEGFKRQLSYWKQQLAGIPQSLELPTDRPRPAVGTTDGASISVRLPQTLVQALKDCAHENGVTLFMVLLASFQTLLYRYSGQEDVVVGSPSAGRNRVEVENLIGLFINTLVMRTDLSGNPTFRELLHRVREVALGAYAHQDLPLEKLVDKLQPQRTLSHRPLFQVMFSLRNVPTQMFELSGLKLELIRTENTSARMDLALFVSESDGELLSRWEYSTDLFDAGTIKRMTEHYEMLLTAVVQSPDERISEISMLPEAEKQQLLAWAQQGPKRVWNSPSLVELFEEQVTLHPAAAAFYFGAESITYRELNDHANRIAHFLFSISLDTPTTVGVCLDRSLDLVAALLGIFKARCVYLPLDLTYPRGRLAYMLEDSRAQVVLTNNVGESLFPYCRARVINLDTRREQIENQKSDNLCFSTPPSDLAYMIYTSGSTGVPKGVAVSHKQILNRFEWMWEAYPLGSEEVCCQKTALSFVDSIWELLGPLLRGCATAIIGEEVLRDPFLFVKELADKKVTRLWLVPTQLASLLDTFSDDLGKRLPHLRFWVSSGEALPVRLLERFKVAMPHATLFNLYGTSEVWDATWYDPLHHSADLHRVPIGRPIPNVQVYVLDAHRQPVPVGLPGELYISGDGLAQGYLHHPEWTAEKFVNLTFHPDRPVAYKTGDRVRFLSDGNIEYLGRFDDQVKLRGYRIDMEEIESALCKFGGIQNCIVALREGRNGMQHLAAYIVTESGQDLKNAQLRAHLKEKLPEYMVPSIFVRVEDFPRTPSGKIDRRALPLPEVEREDVRGLIAARDATEELLVKIWEKTLKVHPVGVTDNFFELGGHSLLAVRLMTEIRKFTGKDIPVAALFQDATVEYLATVLNQGSNEYSYPLVMEIGDTSRQNICSKAPFFCVAAPGANATGYIALKRHMALQRPLYKLQAPRPGKPARVRDGQPYTFEEWKSMAAEYCEAMRFVQPEGPYYLGGMCGGARIAYEIACRLEAEGQKVGMLAIFDTWVMEKTEIPLLSSINWYNVRLRQIMKLSAKERWKVVKDILLRRCQRLHKPRQHSKRVSWQEASWPSSSRFPSTYNGRVTVFRIPTQPYYRIRDRQLGWGVRTTGDVVVHEIQAPAHAMLLRDPYAERLAHKLEESLQAQQGQFQHRQNQVESDPSCSGVLDLRRAG